MNEKANKLFEENRALVTHLVIRINGSFCEELYQEGLIALWRAANSYDETKGDFGSYAYVCIVHKIRQAKKRILNLDKEIIFSDLPFSEDDETRSIELVMLNAVNNEETEDNITDYLLFLEESERNLLLMYLGGMKCSEISRKMGLSNWTICRRIKLIRTKLLKTKSDLRLEEMTLSDKVRLVLSLPVFSSEEKKLIRLLKKMSIPKMEKNLGIDHRKLYAQRKNIQEKIKKSLKFLGLEDFK